MPKAHWKTSNGNEWRIDDREYGISRTATENAEENTAKQESSVKRTRELNELTRERNGRDWMELRNSKDEGAEDSELYTVVNWEWEHERTSRKQNSKNWRMKSKSNREWYRTMYWDWCSEKSTKLVRHKQPCRDTYTYSRSNQMSQVYSWE